MNIDNKQPIPNYTETESAQQTEEVIPVDKSHISALQLNNPAPCNYKRWFILTVTAALSASTFVVTLFKVLVMLSIASSLPNIALCYFLPQCLLTVGSIILSCVLYCKSRKKNDPADCNFAMGEKNTSMLYNMQISGMQMLYDMCQPRSKSAPLNDLTPT